MKRFMQTKQHLAGLIAGVALVAAIGTVLPGALAQGAATGDSKGTSNVLTRLNIIRQTSNATVLTTLRAVRPAASETTLRFVRLGANDPVSTLRFVRPTTNDPVLMIKSVSPAPNDATK